MSPNDIEVRANDIEMSRPVDFRAHPVDFWSVVPPGADRTILGVTHNTGVNYGKKPRNGSAKPDQKVAF